LPKQPVVQLAVALVVQLAPLVVQLAPLARVLVLQVLQLVRLPLVQASLQLLLPALLVLGLPRSNFFKIPLKTLGSPRVFL
jgi:hypothetical protein